MATVRIRIVGEAAPGGSKRSLGKGRPTIPDNKRTKPWMQRVAAAAEKAVQEQNDEMLLVGPVRLTFQQFLPRPDNHFGTGRNAAVLKPNAPRYPHKRRSGDLTKIIRSTEDAMKNVVFKDDKQVVKFGDCGIDYIDRQHAAPYVIVIVEELDDALPGPEQQGGHAATGTIPPVASWSR